MGLRPLTLSDPLRWLVLGTRDFLRAPAIGLLFGGCFVAMGWALLTVFENAPAYVLGLSAGFLLVGPFLCMGLYHVSDRLERGERPRLVDAAMAWRRKLGTLAIFGVVLLVLEMLWARASLVVFALSFQGTMPDFAGSLRSLTDPKNLDFLLAWTALGGDHHGPRAAGDAAGLCGPARRGPHPRPCDVARLSRLGRAAPGFRQLRRAPRTSRARML